MKRIGTIKIIKKKKIKKRQKINIYKDTADKKNPYNHLRRDCRDLPLGNKYICISKEHHQQKKKLPLSHRIRS